LFNNFEQGIGGYKYESGFSDYFKVYAGKDLKTPIVDHTLSSDEGHFMAYDFEKGKDTSRQIFESTYLTALESCVTLWYYIRGNSSLAIQVKRPVYRPREKADIAYEVSIIFELLFNDYYSNISIK